MTKLKFIPVPTWFTRSAQIKLKQVLVALALSLTTVTSQAINEVSLRTNVSTPVNDTLLVNPLFVGQSVLLYVTTHFEGYLDHWYVQLYSPSNMLIDGELAGSDMSVPYVTSDGSNAVFDAILTTHDKNITANGQCVSTISSTINENGYWDPYNSGNYVPYGTVKWAPGDYNDMFSFYLYIPHGTVWANVAIDFTLSSSYDNRGVGVVHHFQHVKNLCLHVGYKRGDISRDGYINISDVTLLNDYILGNIDLDMYQLDAADVNGDGIINISDVTALTDLIQQNSQADSPEVTE